jgi:hypothetical protein
MEDFVGMFKVGKRRLLACAAMCVMLALVLAVCSNAALFGLFKSKNRVAVAAARHSLVIFPFDKDAESAANVPDSFGASVADYVRTTLATSKGYSALLYDERLTPIKRAKEDNVVKDQDVKGPFFTDKPKVTKLADILATDYYLVGSVESYTYYKDKKSVELTLKADLVLARTGKMVQEFVVGATADAGNQGFEEDELRSIAAGKAVEALYEKIITTSPADAKSAPKAAPKAAKPKGK